MIDPASHTSPSERDDDTGSRDSYPPDSLDLFLSADRKTVYAHGDHGPRVVGDVESIDGNKIVARLHGVIKSVSVTGKIVP